MIDSELERQAVAEERSRQKFEAEQRKIEEAKRKAEAASVEQRQACESAPADETSEEPAPAQAPTHAKPQQARKHAYGPLDNPKAAVIADCTQGEVEDKAVQLSVEAMTTPFGIWIPGQLIAIAYGGEVFRKR